MACYRPVKGYRARVPNEATGKRSIVFNARDGDIDDPVDLPCGQCIGCRLERSRQWAIRCMHESSCFTDNCFLTLTYNSDNLPSNGFLDYDAPVLFLKRLRKRFGNGIRSFGCAEYGEGGGRPHYHLLIFNHDFADKVHWKGKGEHALYVSESLSELWPFGFSTVGAVTFDSAAYVARYVTKKVTGDKAKEHYERIDFSTGEVFSRPPERSVCVSRRPGIGKLWYDSFRSDVYPSDSVVMRGLELKPPKYYDRLFDIDNPDEFCKVKARRKSAALESVGKEPVPNVYRGAMSRLQVREVCAEANFNRLKRGYENE